MTAYTADAVQNPAPAPTTPVAVAAPLTPMMAQYIEIKANNPDCLLFYRMGDFYEMFFGDAEIASRSLGIVLTKRGKYNGEDIPMCGVPVERADDYLQRLIALGNRVAVCEQIEDPAEAKKRGAKSVVKRDVIRLVTPGTITEDALLDPGRSNWLAAVSRVRSSDGGWRYGVAATDISTGRFTVVETDEQGLPAEIGRIEPRELLVPDSALDEVSLRPLWRESGASITPLARDGLDYTSAERRLTDYFGLKTLAGLGTLSRAEVIACAAITAYVERTQFGVRPPLSPPVTEVRGTGVRIDAATRANLELTRTLQGEKAGSLLSVIDRTVSPGGARLLAERIAGPLTDTVTIAKRLDAVSFFVDDRDLRQDTRAALKSAPDILRALSRLSMDRGGPRDLAAIRDAVVAADQIASRLARTLELPDDIADAAHAFAALDRSLATTMALALDDELPLRSRDGGFVRSGYEPQLDEARDLRDASRRVIAALQARYADEIGARTLRVKHNNFLGYFVEVPQAIGEKLLEQPFSATFQHRQTMQGAMRFSTSELDDLESRIASAADRALSLELSVFDALTRRVIEASTSLKAAADALAVLDVASSLAERAEEGLWTRPHVDQSLAFKLEGARHPVVEAALARDGQVFVANDTDLSPDGGATAGQIALMTGPNMAGKSTYLRQNAVIALLAQMGSFVPAKRAHIGVVDRLFSRVGAADDLARGRSTFMVEMIETASILNQATERSLVILDEIGRGTATFDGLSIAWATIEHLHETNRCRGLFATHFHELTALVRRLDRLHTLTLRVTDFEGDVIFLHEVVPGVADRSYGIQVAKLAGLPKKVVERARVILDELEAHDRRAPVERLVDDLPLFAIAQRPIAAPVETGPDPLHAAVAALDPDQMTPRDALDALYALMRLAQNN